MDFEQVLVEGATLFSEQRELALEELRKLGELRAALPAIELEWMAEARRLGFSWLEIGEALGISRQAAHRRGRALRDLWL